MISAYDRPAASMVLRLSWMSGGRWNALLRGRRRDFRRAPNGPPEGGTPNWGVKAKEADAGSWILEAGSSPSPNPLLVKGEGGVKVKRSGFGGPAETGTAYCGNGGGSAPIGSGGSAGLTLRPTVKAK